MTIHTSRGSEGGFVGGRSGATREGRQDFDSGGASDELLRDGDAIALLVVGRRGRERRKGPEKMGKGDEGRGKGEGPERRGKR